MKRRTIEEQKASWDYLCAIEDAQNEFRNAAYNYAEARDKDLVPTYELELKKTTLLRARFARDLADLQREFRDVRRAIDDDCAWKVEAARQECIAKIEQAYSLRQSQCALGR